MPWFAVPFDAPQITQRLVTTLLDGESHGIPHLAVIRPDGTTLEVDDVVRQIEADPLGLQFPWPAPPCPHFLPERFCRYSDGTMDQCFQFKPMSQLQNKYLLLYFAGPWNSTCRNYGPQLNEAYRNLKLHHGDDFEVSIWFFVKQSCPQDDNLPSVCVAFVFSVSLQLQRIYSNDSYC
jgi:hypothetical protein